VEELNVVVPPLGCLRILKGEWIAVLNAEGVCIQQFFVPKEYLKFTEADGTPLSYKDPRVKFRNHPFQLPDPRHFCPQFKCLSCGSDRLEEIQEDVTLASEIVGVGPSGDLEYGVASSAGDSGTVARYQCLTCGYIVMNNNGEHVTDAEALSTVLGITE